MSKSTILRLPVVSASAEYLVMGQLMRRNILTYKAPPNNEGYDLICIHPDPRHKPRRGHAAQVKVQVKSRFATDAPRQVPVKKTTLNAFDFLVVVFLNIGRFAGGRSDPNARRPVEFFTFPRAFIRRHYSDSGWGKVLLTPKVRAMQEYRDEAGFEQIARALGVRPPRRA